MTPHEPSPTAVLWPRCSVVYGCTGRAVDEFGSCPAHLRPQQFERFADGLEPGGDLDLRGVTVPPWLLDAVLDAVGGTDGRPHLGRTRFDGAVLPAHTTLRGACVEGDSSFDGACFLGGASFFDAHFLGNVSFRGARFAGNTSFHGVRFQRHASFEETVFAGDALFGEARWHADAYFVRAVFIGAACFDRAGFGRDAVMQGACFGGAVSFRRVQVTRHARFERTRFRHDLWLGPLVAGGRIGLADSSAHGALGVHAAARHVTAKGATVRGVAEFRLRHAELDLEDAAFDGPVKVRSLAHPFQGLTEPSWTGRGTVRLVSLRRVSAKGLDIADVDLSRCRFLGLQQPDRLRITGACSFASLPSRRWYRPWKRGRGRAVLAEDLAWCSGDTTGTGDVADARAGVGNTMGAENTMGAGDPGNAGNSGKTGSPENAADAGAAEDRLETLYRQLAQATAGCDGALARDFRYSALEMRRRTEPDQWRRWALHLLWATSGYGLRAGRLIAWIAIVAALICGGVTFMRHVQHQSPVSPRAHRPGSPVDRASAAPRVSVLGHTQAPGKRATYPPRT